MVRPLKSLIAAAALALQAICLPLASAQTAPAARSYAVLSEIGREIHVVAFQANTGSRIDGTPRRSIPMPSDALDQVVVLTARSALVKLQPQSRPWLIARADSDFFEAADVPPAGARIGMPADLAAALLQQGSTHLLLFTRLRAPASLRFVNSIETGSKLEGLGFYMDNYMMTFRSDTGAEARGFLAPYAYFRATLVDVRSGQVLKSRPITASQTISAAGAKGSGSPWDALSTEEKIEALRTMLVIEVEAAVPLLAAAP